MSASPAPSSPAPSERSAVSVLPTVCRNRSPSSPPSEPPASPPASVADSLSWVTYPLPDEICVRCVRSLWRSDGKEPLWEGDVAGDGVLPCVRTSHRALKCDRCSRLKKECLLINADSALAQRAGALLAQWQDNAPAAVGRSEEDLEWTPSRPFAFEAFKSECHNLGLAFDKAVKDDAAAAAASKDEEEDEDESDAPASLDGEESVVSGGSGGPISEVDEGSEEGAVLALLRRGVPALERVAYALEGIYDTLKRRRVFVEVDEEDLDMPPRRRRRA